MRERKDDIPDLANYFLRKFSVETKKGFTAIGNEALERLVAHAWPGNVRELANVIENAVVLGQGPELTLHDLPAKIASAKEAAAEAERPAVQHLQANAEVAEQDLAARSLPAAIERFERQLIEQALRDCGGTKLRAAKQLGLSRQGLIKKLKRYGIGK